MIEGVRLLPYVATSERLGRRYFWQDCSKCKSNPHIERERFRCGFLPRSRWIGPTPAGVLYVPGTALKDPLCCPGYLAQLPAVHEVARAWGHWDKGQLWQRYTDPPEQLVELVELFNQERAGAESYYLDEKSKEAKR